MPKKISPPPASSPSERAAAVLAQLRHLGSARNVEGMARYGIRPAEAYGVAGPEIHRIARSLGKDHELAAHLWSSGVLEARAVAALIEEVDRVDSAQLDRWAADFDCWAICDTVCGKLFDRTPLAWRKARAWTRRRPEYVRRAGFALMAWRAVHDKRAPDEKFLSFLPLIERAADDNRPMVKKAVNWALRQIGKRNARLHAAAIATAERIHAQGSSSARWIASDALRELRRRTARAHDRERLPRG